MLNLKNFEEQIDQKIISRGSRYYDNGCVVSLEQTEAGIYEAQVEGTDCYTVMVELNDQGNIADSYCNCPYDMGEYCKHQVAVFLAIRDMLGDRGNNNKMDTLKRLKKRSLEDILVERSKEELVGFLLNIASEYDELKERIRYDFDTVNDQKEISQSAKLIRSYIDKSSDRSGFVAYGNTFEATRGAYLVLEKANTALRQNRIPHALDLVLCVLHEMMDLLSGCDDSDGNVGDTIDSSFSLISDLVDGKSFSLIVKQAIFKKLLEEASNKRYEGWIDWRLCLLEHCSMIADTPRLREKLEQKLSNLMKASSEDSWSAQYLNEKINMIRYKMVLLNDGNAAAQAFIMNNLEFTDFRKMAIESALAQKDFDFAIKLALEGEQKDFQHGGLVNDWKTYQYKAFQLSGQLDKQREIAMFFIRNNDFDYYIKLKRTYAPKDWANIYPDIIRDMENNKNRLFGIYAQILIEENEMPKLLQYVKRMPSIIESYAKYLLTDYKQDVFDLYGIYIEEEASRASNRREYQSVCKIIRNLQKISGKDKTQEIKEKLCQRYIKKPAFMDELSKI